MLRPPLEESGTTSRLLRVRDRYLGMGLVVALCSLGIAACGGGERQDANEASGEFPVAIVNADFPSKQQLAGTSHLTLEVQNTGDETIPDLAITVFTNRNTDSNVSGTDTTGGTETTGGIETTGGTETTETDSGQTATAAEGPVAAGSFSVISEQPGLAIPSRPVWILEQGYPRLAGTDAGRPPPGEIAGSGGAESADTDTFSFGSLDPGESKQLVWKVTAVQAGTYTVHYRVAASLTGKSVAVTQDGSIPEGEFVVQITDVPPQTRVDDSGKVVPINPSDIIGQAGTSEQKSELGGNSGGTATTP